MNTHVMLSELELSSIDEYRKKRNTAVLTIMFTDIQGFTNLAETRGDTKVHELHEYHDGIIKTAIEENNSGVIIKYIGDSVMAVFAEPTGAARAALRIQRDLKRFNLEHPELDDIMVRIGLHMGQTVLENKMQTDLFGRHVNKAARIEGLAAGGHIYLSYTVFDSIKSWLIDQNAGFQLHGRYHLKGIPQPEDIYEIYQTEVVKPLPPRNAKKQGRLFTVLAIAAAALLIGAVTVAVLLSRKGGGGMASGTEVATEAPAANQNPAGGTPTAPSASVQAPANPGTTEPAVSSAAPAPAAKTAQLPLVRFMNLHAQEPILDFATPLAYVIENSDQGLCKAISPIKTGLHLLHYEVADSVRYFATFKVVEGENVIPLKFRESRLPGVQVNFILGANNQNVPTTQEYEESFFFYSNPDIKEIKHTAKVSGTVSAVKQDEATVVFTISGFVKLDGQPERAFSKTISSTLNTTTRSYQDEIVLYEDEYHVYVWRYTFINNTFQLNIDSRFK